MAELRIYPDAPGFKVHGPSQQAAERVKPQAPRLRAAVLAEFERWPHGATADQIASALNISVLSARPRVTELRRLGEIEATGERRRNASSMTATVWHISPPLPTAAVSSGEGSNYGKYLTDIGGNRSDRTI